MRSIFTDVVNQVTWEEVGVNVPGQPIVAQLMKMINSVRTLWYWYTKGQTYRTKASFGCLLAGKVTKFLIGDNETVRTAAHCVYIARCITENVKQFRRVKEAGLAFTRVCKNEYSGVTHVDLVVQPRFKKMSCSSSIIAFRYWKATTGKQITQIFKRLDLLLKELFMLSMRMLDTWSAFCMTRKEIDEHTDEMFVNAYETIKAIMDNKEELLRELTQYRHIIEKFLLKLNSKISVNQMIHSISLIAKPIEGLKKFNGFVEKHGGVAERITNQMFTAIGLMSRYSS